MVACEKGLLQLATLLCERGASLNLRAKKGATALFAACANNDVNCAKLLCERGADTQISADPLGTDTFVTPFAAASAAFGADSPIALLLLGYPH